MQYKSKIKAICIYFFNLEFCGIKFNFYFLISINVKKKED